MNCCHQYEVVFKPMHSRTESPSSRLAGRLKRRANWKLWQAQMFFFFFLPFWQSCIKRAFKWERISLTVDVCVRGRASAFRGSYLSVSHGFRNPSFLYVPTPAFPPPNPHSSVDTYSRLNSIRPSLFYSHLMANPSVTSALSFLASPFCKSHLLSPHWLFYSDSLSNRISFWGIQSLRKIIQFHCNFQSFSCFLLRC